jgi:hypothetical protein
MMRVVHRVAEPAIRGSRTAGPARVLGRRLVRVGWPRNADFERSVPGSATRQIAGHVWGVRAVGDVVASGVGDDVARHRAESRPPG